MCRSLATVLLLAVSVLSDVHRNAFAEQDFGVGEIEFSGAKYEKEIFTYLILPPENSISAPSTVIER